MTPEPAHHESCDVDRELDSGAGGVEGQGARPSLLDGHGRQGRAVRGVLHRLKSERGDDLPWAELLDSPAEAPRLLAEQLELPARVGRDVRLRLEHESYAQKGDVAVVPAQRRGRGGLRPRDRRLSER